MMEKVNVRVPGKIMLAGEYSILYDYRALAVSVPCFADVTACFCEEKGLKIISNLWQAPKHFDLNSPPPFEQSVILGTIFRLCQENQIEGLNLKIDSQIKPEYGMGSSSALRLGIALALESLCQGHLIKDPHIKWRLAKGVIEDQLLYQGQASGYDVATQLIGGLVSFHAPFRDWPTGLERLDPSTTLLSKKLRVFIGGRGAATKAVLNDTLIWLTSHQQKKELADRAMELIEMLQIGLIAAKDQNVWRNIFSSIGQYRRIFFGSPHFPLSLNLSLSRIAGADMNWSFKFTGAGGEDAVLLFGDFMTTQPAAECLFNHGWQEFRPGQAFANCFTSFEERI